MHAAAPEVDDRVAVHEDRQRRADLVMLLEVRGERLADAFEARGDLALDLGWLGGGHGVLPRARPPARPSPG